MGLLIYVFESYNVKCFRVLPNVNLAHYGGLKHPFTPYLYTHMYAHTHTHVSALQQSSGEAQSGRRFLGTKGGTLWLWSFLPKTGALGP